MRRYRTALIGCGAIHASHADALKVLAAVEPAVFCDIVPERAARSASLYGGRAETDWTRVLEDRGIDVVHLCTPHFLHAPMAVALLRAGKHVLTEKPMGISLEQCEEMVRAADESGRQLGVCFQNRYNRTSRHLVDLIRSGRAGRVLGARAFLTWHREPDYYAGSPWKGTWEREGGGVLINQAIHTLDLLQLALGMPSTLKGTVDQRSLQDTIEVEDTAEATFRHPDGTRTYFFATNGYPVDQTVEIEVVLEKAVARIHGDLTVSWSDGTTESVSERQTRDDAKAYWGSGHRDLIEDFYACLAEGRPFPVDGRQGMQSIRLIRALYASSEQRAWVTI